MAAPLTLTPESKVIKSLSILILLNGSFFGVVPAATAPVVTTSSILISWPVTLIWLLITAISVLCLSSFLIIIFPAYFPTPLKKFVPPDEPLFNWVLSHFNSSGDWFITPSTTLSVRMFAVTLLIPLYLALPQIVLSGSEEGSVASFA